MSRFNQHQEGDDSVRGERKNAVNLLTVKEAAGMLKLSKSLIYEMVEAGELPHVKIRSAIRFVEADLDAFICENRIEANRRKPLRAPHRGKLNHIEL